LQVLCHNNIHEMYRFQTVIQREYGVSLH